MMERFINKEFQVQSTQQYQCVRGSVVLPVFAFSYLSLWGQVSVVCTLGGKTIEKHG